MATEPIRICGYRKVGGIYIIGPQPGEKCDRLPYPIHLYPVCNSGIKFSGGFQWIDWAHYAGNHNSNINNQGEVECCNCSPSCPVCNPSQKKQPFGVFWVGQEYSPESFTEEACRLGISKRIPKKPRNLKPGDIILLAHNDAGKGLDIPNRLGIPDDEVEEYNFGKNSPAIFLAFPVIRVEELIWQKDANEDKLLKMERAGITPVIIPDAESDHDQDVSNNFTEYERKQRELSDLKKKLLGK